MFQVHDVSLIFLSGNSANAMGATPIYTIGDVHRRQLVRVLSGDEGHSHAEGIHTMYRTNGRYDANGAAIHSIIIFPKYNTITSNNSALYKHTRSILTRYVEELRILASTEWKFQLLLDPLDPHNFSFVAES